MRTKTYLYSIFDRATKEYGPVLEFASDEAAIRALKNLIKTRPDSPISLNPEDFSLVKLAEFDDDGFIKGYVEPDYIEFIDDKNEVQ